LEGKRFVLNDTRYQYWKLIEEVTRRNLTVKEDMLKAFQGVLNYIAAGFRGKFFYGVPEDFLEAALLGHANGQDLDSPFSTTFPSWSWVAAGRSSQMNYLRRHARLGGLRSFTTFFRIDSDSQKTLRLSSDFSSQQRPIAQFRIGFMIGSTYTNRKVRELLVDNKIPFDRALCCYSEVVELQAASTCRKELAPEQARR
jgi:hypothetical protein